MTTLDDILAIDGNRAVYQRLQALLADGTAMAFIGAGASFPLYPLWGQLIELLADEPQQWGLASEADKQQWLRTAASPAPPDPPPCGAARFWIWPARVSKWKLYPAG